MHQIIGGIVIGAILGKTSGKLRPLVRKAVKTGLISERKVREFGQSLRHEASELVAEAKAELAEEARSGGQ
jgi:hypothetical protein